MAPGNYRFGPFVLDLADRRLRRDGAPVELNARYLDALALLVREQGTLVSKDRFLDEVWSGVPVTDEALTQCIKTLRRQLGDDATRPRFIETVPKHGYRFIAAVEPGGGPPGAASSRPVDTERWRRAAILGLAGTIGGGAAGLIGGLVYGLAASAQPQPGLGAVSVLLILICLTVAIALLGAAGVAFGIAAGGLAPGPRWQGSVAGGALGGFAVGAIVKLIGLDAFQLLLGQSPGDITGPKEGVALGAAVGLAAWLARRFAGSARLRNAMALAGLVGGTAGAAITALGGELMAGSLDLLVRGFPNSRLRLDPIGGLFGESGFGPVSRVASGALEAALFAACIVGGMILAERKLAPPAS